MRKHNFYSKADVTICKSNACPLSFILSTCLCHLAFEFVHITGVALEAAGHKGEQLAQRGAVLLNLDHRRGRQALHLLHLPLLLLHKLPVMAEAYDFY